MSTPGGADEQGWGRQEPQGGNPYGGNPYGGQQPPYGGNPYGGNPYGGQQPHGGGNPYGGNPYGGQQPHGGNPYGGQQPYGQQPYGGVAPMPGGVTPPPDATRPGEVRTAFWLWIASMVVSIVGSVVVFATVGDEVRRQLDVELRSDPTLDPAVVETAVRLTIIVGAVFAVLFVALQLFFVVKMRSGRNWARVVLTVLGSLSVVSTVVSLSSAGLADAGFGLVQAILIVAAVVFMYTGGARDHFAPRPKY